MKQIHIPKIDLQSVYCKSTIDFIDNDFAIFNSIKEVPVSEYPSRIDLAVVAVCRTGFCRIGINLKEYNVESNSLVITLPNQIIQLFEVSPDFSGAFIAVSRNFVDNMFPKFKELLPIFLYLQNNPCARIGEYDLGCILEYHTFLWKKVRMNDNIYRKGVAQGILQAMFYDVCNIFRMHMNVVKKSRKEELFELFIESIYEHYKKERTVSFYAGKLCVTPKYLSSLVKTVSGKTAGEWIAEVVILESKVLLKSSPKSTQEISVELNFANQSFFGKYFKQHTGMSPYAYKKI
jgi:hypothetical protein